MTDPLNHTTSYTYDTNNNRTRATDANGHALNCGYDVLDRLQTVTDAVNG